MTEDTDRYCLFEDGMFDDTDPELDGPTQPRVSPFESTLPGLGGRRDVPRRQFRAKVDAYPLDGRLPSITGQTNDICDKGLFVASRSSIQVGSRVILKLHTDYGPLRLTARVVHNIQGMGFGCAFTDITPYQRAAIDLLVSHKRMRSPRTVH